MSDRIAQLRTELVRPIDGASLAVFRMLFGLLMAWEAFRYLRFGYVKEYYLDAPFHFTFQGFDWVQVHHPVVIYGLYALLGLCGLAIAWGVVYRAAIVLFACGFAYVFLLDTSYYLNHYYVIVLLAGALAVSPASHLFGWEKRSDKARREQVPVWTLWILRAQLQVIYIYAAIAKLNSDWLAGEPVRTWLSPLAREPVVGWLFQHDAAFYAISYSGIVVDGVVAPLLLFRRTRVVALGLLAAFHVLNELFFRIGVFPPLMLAANMLFLSPSWPRRLPRILREQLGLSAQPPAGEPLLKKASWGLTLALGLFALVQLVLPLRHHLYPGDVAWTEEGHKFSWRMRLRDKQGTVVFFTKDKHGRRVKVEETTRLSTSQRQKMACQPEMILQYAHHLGRQISPPSGPGAPIFAEAKCRVNAGPSGLLVAPNVDLTREARSIAPYGFIMPRP